MDTNANKNDGVLNSTFLVPEGEGAEHEEAGGEQGAEVEAQPEGEAQPQKTPLGRRAKARERDEKILSEIQAEREERKERDRLQEQRDREYREHLEAIRRENAELRGQISARTQDTRRDTELPDYDKLREQARAALDAKDFAKWERLNDEAVEARLLQKYPHLRQAPQAQPQQAPQVNQALQVYAYTNYADVMNDRAAIAVAAAHSQKLGEGGMPEGPERWKQSFEAGRRYLGGGTSNGPQFSQRNREILGGTPTNGSGGKGGGEGSPGVVLTAEERATAKRYKMSEQDYAQQMAAMHPERIVK